MYDEVVIPKGVRVSFPLQIISNRQIALHRTISDKSRSTRVKSKDIPNHAPHAWISQVFRLTEDGGEVLAGPFECTAVA